MFTTIDKALTALIMAVLWLVQYFTGWTVPGVDEGVVATLLGLLSPLLVYLVPNKKPEASIQNLTGGYR